MYRQITLALLLIGASAANAQSVYRCSVDGRTVFQDRPCAGSAGQRIEVPKAPAAAPPDRVQDESPSLAEQYQERVAAEREANLAAQREQSARLQSAVGERKELERLQNLAVRGNIAVGMTTEQVSRAWGSPTRVNSSSYGSTQWVYRKPDYRADYVYFEDGLVTSWDLSR